jgi:hypothetical protein
MVIILVKLSHLLQMVLGDVLICLLLRRLRRLLRDLQPLERVEQDRGEGRWARLLQRIERRKSVTKWIGAIKRPRQGHTQTDRLVTSVASSSH